MKEMRYDDFDVDVGVNLDGDIGIDVDTCGGAMVLWCWWCCWPCGGR